HPLKETRPFIPDCRVSRALGTRQFALACGDILVTRLFQNSRMPTEIQTMRVRRTWLDKFQFWQRAYQTKIFDERHEVYGRGPTGEASVEAAERRWTAAFTSENPD